MTLFDSILSLLGLKSSDSKRQSSTDVSVEHDPDAENEAAVKGTDASASTGSVTEEPPQDDAAAEPAEATSVTDHAGEDHEAAEPAEAAGPVTDEPDPETAEPSPVDASPESNTPAAAETADADDSEADADDSKADESVAAGSDATASTGSMTDEPDHGGESAEPAEATSVTDHAGEDHEAAEPAEAAGPVGDETEPSDLAEDASEDPVDTVSGIGPAYASKLGDAGVETVAELAAADPAALAEETDISEKRLTRLVERARKQLD